QHDCDCADRERHAIVIKKICHRTVPPEPRPAYRAAAHLLQGAVLQATRRLLRSVPENRMTDKPLKPRTIAAQALGAIEPEPRGLRAWLTNEAPLFRYHVDLADMSGSEAVGAAMRPDTKLAWIETPASPLWSITDIAGVAGIAHAAGAVLAMESTAATPLFTQP